MRPETDSQPLAHTSCLDGRWRTATEYEQGGLTISPEGFASATNVLLTQPNLNSSHLFRADILYDSTKQLKTPTEIERDRCISLATKESDEGVPARTPGTFPGFSLTRSVVRKLIPRNLQLDRTLIQSCHVYEGGDVSTYLVVYWSHADSADATPWYHPPVEALAYLYKAKSRTEQDAPGVSISVHILPFETSSPSNPIPIPTRLHRTLLSLLRTLTRLAKGMSCPVGDTFNIAIAPKDNIIPQHIVQNTYSRLKQTYSTDLISRWVEKTEPSKHVFEDISIAAFLIELWRQMYSVLPACERSTSTTSAIFPGFVDVACGNGVLVYLLRSEGYEGWGFDARRRRTWEVLPGDVEQHLLEQVLVPEPFLRAMARPTREEFSHNGHQEKVETGRQYHSGIFKAGTFIISNHADELTPWTPILAAISSPTDPLPWLAIPCCSHALSGAVYRYPVSKPISQLQKYITTSISTSHGGSSILDSTKSNTPESDGSLSHGKQCYAVKGNSVSCVEEEKQPTDGDLKALRAAKAKAASGADQSSTYACLTAKVTHLAEELGIGTERTLMRIPSTRNIGIIGGRRRAGQKPSLQPEIQSEEEEECHTRALLQDGLRIVKLKGEALASGPEKAARISDIQQEGRGVVTPECGLLSKIEALVEQECRASGGVAAAAQIWVERAKSLQVGQGRGKLNAGKDRRREN